jgi:hypothetical protein
MNQIKVLFGLFHEEILWQTIVDNLICIIEVAFTLKMIYFFFLTLIDALLVVNNFLLFFKASLILSDTVPQQGTTLLGISIFTLHFILFLLKLPFLIVFLFFIIRMIRFLTELSIGLPFVSLFRRLFAFLNTKSAKLLPEVVLFSSDSPSKGAIRGRLSLIWDSKGDLVALAEVNYLVLVAEGGRLVVVKDRVGGMEGRRLSKGLGAEATRMLRDLNRLMKLLNSVLLNVGSLWLTLGVKLIQVQFTRDILVLGSTSFVPILRMVLTCLILVTLLIIDEIAELVSPFAGLMLKARLAL